MTSVEPPERLRKANFDDLYTSPDPRAYYRALRPLDYRVPHHGSGFFRSVLARLPVGDRVPRVLDLCCSYGINGALLKYDVEFEELYDHYCAPDAADLPVDGLLRRDREFFGPRGRSPGAHVTGLDTSAAAIAYGREAGLLDAGHVRDLERDEPSGDLVATMAGVDLVTTTGGVGYITERTFDRLFRALPATPGRSVPWVAAVVLRVFPYDGIARTLARYGLTTRRLGAPVPQRRFRDAAEQADALAALDRLGVDPTGHEDDGHFYADLYLSAPAAAHPALGIPAARRARE
ncbi:class I SAM-dependent methyltransferase [Saccharothrix obliqua]|uniref:class I SAM-dependent methyltransferase n=1 Tax=Saccharothrix obliqua TaxID=2861747 RepID=UPI001C5EE156|nr:class I SAM-dependent methyltransferase [Saccharothrix obliqua]MBW4718611.1 class I SAM-dependent methyltransferase [Saccharothrix obliqua]